MKISLTPDPELEIALLQQNAFRLNCTFVFPFLFFFVKSPFTCYDHSLLEGHFGAHKNERALISDITAVTLRLVDTYPEGFNVCLLQT